jgi:hypothetical protein
MRRHVFAARALGLALLASVPSVLGSDAAHAETAREVSVSTARIRLGDVLGECEGRTCDVDLGPAPPVGSSRLIDVSTLREALTAAGADLARYSAEAPVRVTSKAKTYSPAEFAAWVRPSVERSLPLGVRLLGVEAKARIMLPELAVLGEPEWPPLPKRAGQVATTLLIDVLHDGLLVRRVPLLVRVVVSERAAQAAVARGQSITLVIERRSATISAQGVALKDTDIGQIAPFRVQRTGRVLNARVRSAEIAAVVEDP